MDRWLRAALPPVDVDAGFAAVSRSLRAVGFTGVTDATPDREPEDLRDLATAARSGDVAVRLHLMAPARAVLPDPAPNTVSIGPVKLMLDDDALPWLDDVIDLARRAHAEGRGLAVHCVTATQLVFTLAALDAAGPHAADRVEHAAVVPPDLVHEPRAATRRS